MQLIFRQFFTFQVSDHFFAQFLFVVLSQPASSLVFSNGKAALLEG